MRTLALWFRTAALVGAVAVLTAPKTHTWTNNRGDNSLSDNIAGESLHKWCLNNTSQKPESPIRSAHSHTKRSDPNIVERNDSQQTHPTERVEKSKEKKKANNPARIKPNRQKGHAAHRFASPDGDLSELAPTSSEEAHALMQKRFGNQKLDNATSHNK